MTQLNHVTAGLIVAALLGAAVHAQEPASRPARLAAGWAAISDGLPTQASKVADGLLKERPDDHDAISLAVAARADLSPLGALDSYERWLAVRQHEDRYLLQPIAAAVLDGLSEHAEPRIRYAALTARARAGDTEAQSVLEEASATAQLPLEAEQALAMAGHAEGIARLEARVSAPDQRDKSAAIDALRAAGSRGSATVLAGALQHQSMATRMAAATALGELGDAGAIPALKAALTDPDPPVRVAAGAALARLGDPAGLAMIPQLEASPAGAIRLLAASVRAAQGSDEGWVAPATALLHDADPLVRLQAVDLLLQGDRNVEAATAALETALRDPTPGLRSLAAARVGLLMKAAGDQDLARLRQLLRDPLDDVRLRAAEALLWGSGDRR